MIEIKRKIKFRFLALTSNIWGFTFRFFMRSPMFRKKLLAQIAPLSSKCRDKVNIYIVTSVISPSLRKLSYSMKRSFFDDADRLQQTIDTLESIRKNDSSADIVLIDCSRNRFLLRAEFERFEIYRITKWIPRLVINGPFKGLGEAIMLISSFNLTSQYRTVSKLSGRYKLISQPISNVEALFSLSDKKAITIYYRLSNDLYRKWLIFVESNLSHLSRGVSIENLFTEFTENSRVHPVEKLGVEGLNGVTGGLTKL